MLAILTAVTLTACGGDRGNDADADGGRLSIATGNTTGVYYQLGGGYARLIGQNVPGWSATAEATGARWRTSAGWWPGTATSPSPWPTVPRTRHREEQF